MIVRFTAALMLPFLCSCASPSVSAPISHTLAGNPGLPAREIEKQIGPTQWQKLCHLEYDAFVLMDAQIRVDGSLRLGSIRESSPDPMWWNIARSLSAEAKLNAASIGSHIDPQAEVLVVFFKPALDGNLALVFARQKAEPAPGMTRKALYLEVRRY